MIDRGRKTHFDLRTAALWVRRVVRNRLDLPTKKFVSNKQRNTKSDQTLRATCLSLVCEDVVQFADGLREVANREAVMTDAAILLVPRMNAHMMAKSKPSKRKS